MFLAFKKTKILQLFFLFLLVFLVLIYCDRQTIRTNLTPITITGKGASASLLHILFFEHKKINPQINIEYEVIGGTAVIQEFQQQTVDFAISDRTITAAEIKEVNNGVVFLPITADAISVVYNLPEIKHNLRLSREVLANIFLGKITNWNDPQIQKINSSIKLPARKIALVYRADSSMINWIFTKYLSVISKEWQHTIIYFSWILMYQEYDNFEKLQALKNFLNWGLSDGQKIAENYDYIYLPKKITTKAEVALRQIKYTKD